jgi:hypothetical protein
VSAFDRLINTGKPCDQADLCWNSPKFKGEEAASCSMCRLAPANLGTLLAQRWAPVRSGFQHPLLVLEKLEEAREKREAGFQKILAKNKQVARQRVQKSARQAEINTQEEVIQATRNSGRTNRDGDHLLDTRIVLDTKQQSKRIHPLVNLAELEKVRRQARENNRAVGGLVLHNKHGVKVVVFALEDLSRIAVTTD